MPTPSRTHIPYQPKQKLPEEDNTQVKQSAVGAVFRKSPLCLSPGTRFFISNCKMNISKRKKLKQQWFTPLTTFLAPRILAKIN